MWTYRRLMGRSGGRNSPVLVVRSGLGAFGEGGLQPVGTLAPQQAPP